MLFRSIFIGNLESHITEEELWNNFAPFGNINKVKLFRKLVKSKRCCVIEYESPWSVYEAIDKKNLRKMIPSLYNLDSKLEEKS